MEGGVRPDHGRRARPPSRGASARPRRAEPAAKTGTTSRMAAAIIAGAAPVASMNATAWRPSSGKTTTTFRPTSRRAAAVSSTGAMRPSGVLGPEPDAEHEIEAAPVQQAEQDLVRNLAGDGMRITDPARHDACRDPQRQQREGIEQCGIEEGAHRRFAGMAREDAVPCPLQQHACQPFRGEAGDDDAEQERRHAEAKMLRQAHEVVTQRRQAGEDLLHPFGERVRNMPATPHSHQRSSRPGPRRRRAPQGRRPSKPAPAHVYASSTTQPPPSERR